MSIVDRVKAWWWRGAQPPADEARVDDVRLEREAEAGEPRRGDAPLSDLDVAEPEPPETREPG